MKVENVKILFKSYLHNVEVNAIKLRILCRVGNVFLLPTCPGTVGKKNLVHTAHPTIERFGLNLMALNVEVRRTHPTLAEI
ncbi:MAG: hypothetical protein ABFS56_28770 [Pseudomonadota bacterium]